LAVMGLVVLLVGMAASVAAAFFVNIEAYDHATFSALMAINCFLQGAAQ